MENFRRYLSSNRLLDAEGQGELVNRLIGPFPDTVVFHDELCSALLSHFEAPDAVYRATRFSFGRALCLFREKLGVSLLYPGHIPPVSCSAGPGELYLDDIARPHLYLSSGIGFLKNDHAPTPLRPAAQGIDAAHHTRCGHTKNTKKKQRCPDAPFMSHTVIISDFFARNHKIHDNPARSQRP